VIRAFATNNRINLYLIQNLSGEAWNAKPAKGRNIPSIVAHIHSVRLMWLKAAGASEIPPKLDPETLTKEQAMEALEASGKALEEKLRAALDGDGKIKGFKPDVTSFFAYLVAHDAHHRGQITLLARQAGYPLSQKAMYGMWEWGVR
jgi:uncharacterized damage-inducible protein DinB